MDEERARSVPNAPPDSEVTPIKGGPPPAPGGREASRWNRTKGLVVALAAVVVVAAAVVVWLLQSTVPNGDLEAAEMELAATRTELSDTQADLASTREQAEADLAAAADREANLNGVVSGLEDDVAGLRAELAVREGELSESQAEVAVLTESLTTEQGRAEAVEAQVAAAADAVEQSFTTWKFYLAWLLWGNPDWAREIERQDGDASGYDEIVQALGLGDTWAEWTRAEGNAPLRELDTLMEGINDEELETLFDAWFDCSSRRSCVRTAAVFDGSALGAITEQLQAVGQALGNALLFGSEL